MTLERTWRPGTLGAGGWTELVTGPGEPHQGRLPSSSATVLVCLVHLTDLHLCDAESPARQEYLDHHGDPGAPYAGRLGAIGTYRPQELLTVPVAVAALHAVHRLGRAPVSGAALDAVVVTGDVTDNAQRNELSWYAALMAGGPLAARSGGPRSGWVGGPDATWFPHFWHPEGAPPGTDRDVPTARYGFPTVPGLVEAARSTLTSPGAGLPWLTVHGNHDALLQGTVAPDERLRALAVGDARVVDLSPGQTPLVVLEGVAPLGPARYTHDDDAPRETVIADQERALLRPGELVEVLAGAVDSAGAGTGTGGVEGARLDHAPGAADAPAAVPWACWASDVAQVRVIALDTVNPHGGWQGSVDETQLAWLQGELSRASGYVVVTSHHPSWALTNAYAPPGAPPRHLADAVLALLLRHPGVVAWVSGHVHRHSHHWHQAADRAGGLWEVTTSSLIDWPQQLRVLELFREPEGTVALVSTVLDHAAAGWDRDSLDDPLVLAGLSRTLAVNDYRARSRAVLGLAAGERADRNAVWRLPDPFA